MSTEREDGQVQDLIRRQRLYDIGDGIRAALNTETEYSPAAMATALNAVTYRGAVSVELDAETQSYTVPAGYHNGSGTVGITVATTAEVLEYLGVTT